MKASKGGKDSLVVLRPVGISDDGTELIFARRANARGSFRVKIDDALVEQLVAARDVVTRPAEPADEAPERPPPPPPAVVESKLSVKEIQNLLREGRSVEAIAKKAEVDVHWIERWEGPIVWERAGMAARAQRATLSRSRRGPSALPLGDAVRGNLKRRGITLDPEQWAEAWDSVRDRRAGTWTVTFALTARNRTRTAQWRYDPETDQLTARNELAGELGWAEPKRRRAAAR